MRRLCTGLVLAMLLALAVDGNRTGNAMPTSAGPTPTRKMVPTVQAVCNTPEHEGVALYSDAACMVKTDTVLPDDTRVLVVGAVDMCASVEVKGLTGYVPRRNLCNVAPLAPARTPAPPATPAPAASGLPEPKAICNAPEDGIPVFSDADCQQTSDKILLNGAKVEMLESAPMCAPVGIRDERSAPGAYYTGYIPRWYLCFSGTMPDPSTYDPWERWGLSILITPVVWGVFAVLAMKKAKEGNLHWLLSCVLLVMLLPVAYLVSLVLAFNLPLP